MLRPAPAPAPATSIPRPPSAIRRSWVAADSALRRLFTASDVVVLLLALVAMTMWAVYGADVPLRAMTDLGLGSVLPPGMWAALLLITLAFLVALRAGRPRAIVLALVTTVVMVHGLGVITEPTMRFSVSWRHLGISDYIGARGALDPTLDAYQSWPGFFALSAFLRDVTGLTDPSPVLAWTPVFYNLLYLIPILAIGRRLLGDVPAVWLGGWIAVLGNWIGQDYYSPQGWFLFIYLVVLAILLTWFADLPPNNYPHGWHRLEAQLYRFRRPGTALVPAPPDDPASLSQRTGLLVSMVLLTGVMIAGHQLTPFALLLSVTLLALVGWSRLRAFPVVVWLGVMLWLGFAASAYVDGHGEELRSQVGAVGSIVDQTVGDRLTGSAGHEVIVELRLAVTAVLWLLAAAGVVRLIRSGRAAVCGCLVVAAGSTFALLGLQSYGGEALLRIALFSTPFMALLAAVALVGPRSAPPGPRPLALVAVVAVLAVGTFPFVRYGNERMDWYSADEVATVRAMYADAPRGSVLAAVTEDLPWQYTGYDDYDYRVLVTTDGKTPATGPDVGDNEYVDVSAAPSLLAAQVASRMTGADGQRSFLVLTRNQGGELELLNGEPPGVYERLVAGLDRSKRFVAVERNADSVLYELVGGTP